MYLFIFWGGRGAFVIKKKLTGFYEPKVLLRRALCWFQSEIPSGPGGFSVCALHVPLIAMCVLSTLTEF